MVMFSVSSSLIAFAIALVVNILLEHWYIFRKTSLSSNELDTKKEDESLHPSKFIDMFIPLGQAEDMQANLTEAFPLWVERHGLAAAHRIRKVQIARLIIGEYWNKAIELIKAVKLAGS
jgi:hypothetical protein